MPELAARGQEEFWSGVRATVSRLPAPAQSPPSAPGPHRPEGSSTWPLPEGTHDPVEDYPSLLHTSLDIIARLRPLTRGKPAR